jgi:hypothetical protein
MFSVPRLRNESRLGNLAREKFEWTSIVNSAEENRFNFCKDLDGRVPFSPLYGTCIVSLKELKAVFKWVHREDKVLQ